MVVPIALAHVVLLAISATTTAALAVYAWRRLPEPGARPFIGLMAAVTVWTASYAAGLLTAHPRWRLVWEQAQWLGIPFVPLAFFLFALEYTGNDELVTRRGLAVLSAVPVASTVLAWTNGWHGLLWPETTIAVVDGVAFAVQSFGPWFWVNLLYTYVLLGVGGFLLLRLVVLSDYLYVDQAALLAVGVLVPVAGNVVSIVGPTPYPGIDLVPYSLAVTGLAFGNALFRYRLFELVPATREIGRRAAIADLDDGVVIVDADDLVVYCNRSAAEVFGPDADDALGRPVRALLGDDELSFDTEDALAAFERDGRSYEVRASPIRDQHGRELGHTLVVQDVTARKRRERTLRHHRDELATLNRINEVIREVNAALVRAATRSEVERAVCERLAGSELYRAAWLGRGVLAEDQAVEWTAAAGTPPGTDGQPSPEPGTASDAGPDGGPPVASGGSVRSEEGAWTTVPVAYGRTVYGALVLFTDRLDAFGDRELAVLDELGETVGHAIDAAERKRLLAANAVVEVELAGGESALARTAARTGARLELEGVVPAGEGEVITYLSVEGATAAAVREAAAGASGVARVRVVGDDATAGDGAKPGGGADGSADAGAADDGSDDAPGDGGLLEVALSGGSMVVPLAARGANVVALTAADGTCRVVAEVAPDADVRGLVSAVREAVPDASLTSKRDRDRPVAVADLPEAPLPGLSKRQRQAIEAAYHAGYFAWPRESTGEEVAEAMDVSAPTFYTHLRKAQNKLLAAVVGPDDGPGALRSPESGE